MVPTMVPMDSGGFCDGDKHKVNSLNQLRLNRFSWSSGQFYSVRDVNERLVKDLILLPEENVRAKTRTLRHPATPQTSADDRWVKGYK
jgi:hypothetical protein